MYSRLDYNMYSREYSNGRLTMERGRIWSLFSLRGWMSQRSQPDAKSLKDSGKLLVFRLHWNPKDGGSNIGEGMF